MTDLLTPYKGNDLGANYSKEGTFFRLWAPTASQVEIHFFSEGNGNCLTDKVLMDKAECGTWTYTKTGDCNHLYYTYLVTVDDVTRETVDPYARTTGVNGLRGMVLDLSETNPDGFDQDRGPAVNHRTDCVITEITVSDITADASAGAKYPGKYLGLTEHGTKNAKGQATGLDYLADLGVTHVQILPSYDFGSVDETKPLGEEYNWGYDPVNYNVPEGSYSTDPYHGQVRVKEYKQMVQALHQAGLGVILDVVFNHTYDVIHSVFEKTVPGYYYRKNEDGTLSDASACGNEVASDQPMMRKYIVDSVCYWAKEYHVDGYRFDLMGVLDIETMQLLYDELKKINPNIIVYGEGWTGGDSTLAFEKRAMKINTSMSNGIGAFSDDMRDNVRGSVFYDYQKGFATGRENWENQMTFSVVGACRHPQIDYSKYIYTPTGPWAKSPEDVINYASCHDNMTLMDKLTVSCPEASVEEKHRMNMLVAAIIFTSQGVPFFLQGEEIGRTKPIKGSNNLCENSYNMPLYTNSIKYEWLEENADLLAYYKGLMAMRKALPELRMYRAEDVAGKLKFIESNQKNLILFTIEGQDRQVLVCYNAAKEAQTISLPSQNTYEVWAMDGKAGCLALDQIQGQARVEAVSCMLAVSTKNA